MAIDKYGNPIYVGTEGVFYYTDHTELLKLSTHLNDFADEELKEKKKINNT